MTTLDNFSERLDMEFGLMPIAIEEQRALLEREYHDRQSRFEKSFVPPIVTENCNGHSLSCREE